MDSEMLTSLSAGELEALADGLLAPAKQSRLDELLAKKSANTIIGDEGKELDHLLKLADQLTVLKTRARYTLHHLKVAAAGA